MPICSLFFTATDSDAGWGLVAHMPQPVPDTSPHPTPPAERDSAPTQPIDPPSTQPAYPVREPLTPPAAVVRTRALRHPHAPMHSATRCRTARVHAYP
jgi:hypothetical protein